MVGHLAVWWKAFRLVLDGDRAQADGVRQADHNTF
jgi:hypothetical protein